MTKNTPFTFKLILINGDREELHEVFLTCETLDEAKDIGRYFFENGEQFTVEIIKDDELLLRHVRNSVEKWRSR